MARPKDLIVTMIGSYPTGPDIAVADQLEAGLNLITDGQTRADMIRLFAERTPGLMMEMTPKGERAIITDRIKGTDVVAKDLVDDYMRARTLSQGMAEVKAIVTGPVTMAFSSEIRTGAYKNYRDPRLFMDMAEAVRGFARAFIGAGARTLQIDEPFLSVGAPMQEAKAAIEYVAKGFGMDVTLHVCGDVTKPVPDGKGGAVPLFNMLLEFEGIGTLSHAFMGQERNRALIDRALLEGHGKRLGLGCIDTARHEIETKEDVSSLIRAAMEKVGWGNLVIHPDCGLRTLPHEVAKDKLMAMVAGLQAVDP